MPVKRFFLIALVTLLFVVSKPLLLNSLMPLSALPVQAHPTNAPKANLLSPFQLAQTHLEIPADLAQAEAERDQTDEALQLFQKGVEQYNQSQFREALDTFQQVLVLVRAVGERQGEAATLNYIGDVYRNLEKYSDALKFFEQALVIAKEVGNKVEEEKILNNIGVAYRNLGQYPKALQFYEQALTIAREVEDKAGEDKIFLNIAEIYTNLGLGQQSVLYLSEPLSAKSLLAQTADQLQQQGIEHFQTSQFQAAMQSWQHALAFYRETGDRKAQSNTLSNLGEVYRILGNYSKAIEYQQQSLAIAQEMSDREQEGQALSNLGNAYSALGDNAKALESYQQALVIARESSNAQREAIALGNLGVAYGVLGDNAKAIESYQQALVIARKIGDRSEEGRALNNLGNAYNVLGDLTQAIEYQQQSLVIAREIGDRLGESKGLGFLGDHYYALGDYTKAIEYQQQSLAIAKEIGDRQGESSILGTLGEIYRNLGNYTKAIEYQQQKLAIAKENGNAQQESHALGYLGNAYLSLGDLTQAIDYYEQALAIFREIGNLNLDGEAAILGNSGMAHRSLGNYTKAIEYQNQRLLIARKSGNRQGEAIALSSLGNSYYSLGDYGKAIEYQQQSLAIARQIGDLNGEGYALNTLGVALFQAGNLPEAEKILREAIKTRESIRTRLGIDDDDNRVSIADTRISTSVYSNLQQVLIARNQPEAALEIAEGGRARTFVELLANRLSTDELPVNPAKNSSVPPSITQLQQVASEQKATLVEYSIIGEELLYIWVIQPTGKIAFRQVNLKTWLEQQAISLEDLVIGTRESLGVSRSIFSAEVVNSVDEENQTKRLQQLHQLLIEPIADLLPTDANQRIIFIPQGELFLVPFAALQDEVGKYLIEKHTILTTPSIQVLQLTRQQQQRVGAEASIPLQANNALVLGNPTMPSLPPKIGEKPQQLTSLPGAKREAEAIAPLLNTKALIGNEATETAVKAKLPQARIVHLATHGLFDDFQGLQSAIALAPTSSDNGLLTAAEILNLKLDADLVVLSACNTGRGRITGDGVIGLSRSLFLAGTPSVIVSLWAVPDAPTAELMTEFYTNLYQKKLDKAQALRQAMLKMMEKHRNNPRAWAAFTLIGEAE